MVDSLPDLAALSPAAACALPGGAGSVRFASLALAPALPGPSALLFQQGAAVALGHRALARQLLAPVLVRLGLETLPPPEPAQPDLSAFQDPGGLPLTGGFLGVGGQLGAKGWAAN